MRSVFSALLFPVASLAAIALAVATVALLSSKVPPTHGRHGPVAKVTAAQAELRRGNNEGLKRIARQIILGQGDAFANGHHAEGTAP